MHNQPNSHCVGPNFSIFSLVTNNWGGRLILRQDSGGANLGRASKRNLQTLSHQEIPRVSVPRQESWLLWVSDFRTKTERHTNSLSKQPHICIHKDSPQFAALLTSKARQGLMATPPHTQNPAPLQHTDPQPTTLLAELPRPRVFLTVDMSHWSPNTDLGVSLQRAIYISLSICQPV